MYGVKHTAWAARSALEKQIQQIDLQRKALLCQLADFDLANEKEPDFWDEANLARWREEHDTKVAQREKRRAWERETGRVVAPGPWDADLDLYHGETGIHEWDLGDGFKGKVVRGGWHLGWNGYVEVPESHWASGMDYDEVAGTIGWNLTFGEGNKFGFDHNGERDLTPYSLGDYNARTHYSGKHPAGGARYFTRADVMEEVAQLKTRLQKTPAEYEAEREAAAKPNQTTKQEKKSWADVARALK
jgi:hypothetical protein